MFSFVVWVIVVLSFSNGDGIVRRRRDEWCPFPSAWWILRCFFLCVLALLLFGGCDVQRGFLLGSIPLITFGEIFFFLRYGVSLFALAAFLFHRCVLVVG